MPADYSAWLTQIENETSFGLSQITGTSFALQRVSGISVTAESVNMDSSGGMAVPYQVHAQWPGSDEGSPPTLLMSNETIAGMETELLMALTGGRGALLRERHHLQRGADLRHPSARDAADRFLHRPGSGGINRGSRGAFCDSDAPQFGPVGDRQPRGLRLGVSQSTTGYRG